MKIVIFGGAGQMGKAFSDHWAKVGHQVIAPRLEVRDRTLVFRLLEAERPDAVLNLVAKANIDWCEENRLTAFEINTIGADTVADCCAEQKLYLIHMSTGCLQESLNETAAHREEDSVTPLCFYSWTKYWAEELLLHRAHRQGLSLLVLRPRQPLSSELSARNALVKLLTYTKFIDTPNSCTIIPDLLEVTDKLIARKATGVFNVANPGIMTPYRMAMILQELLDQSLMVARIPKAELNRMTKAERIDTVLDCTKLQSLGISLPPIEGRVRDMVQELKIKLSTEEGRKLLEKVRAETFWKLSLQSA